MVPLPAEIIGVLRCFESCFRGRVWVSALVLLVGSVLTPGQRTVTAALRIMGLQRAAGFQTYHRVLNRDHWSSYQLSRILLHLLVHAFVPADRPIVVGMDETIERRRGAKIAAKGIYRDPVRSSKEHFVKASGLRWIALMLLVPIPWAQRIWALPFLTVLAPSARYHQERGRRHQNLTDWGRQLIRQLRRWLPDRLLIVVADSSYAVLDLLADAAGLAQPVTVITRLRLDAALYDPAPARPAHTKGRPRRKGARQPTLAQRLLDPRTAWEERTIPWYGGQERTVELASGTAVWYHPGSPIVPLRWVLLRDPQGRIASQALLSTDQFLTPSAIVGYFVWRWQVEVTFHEVRTHLGVETQRQWSDRAILRTTPTLLGLFSLVTLWTHELLPDQPLPVRQCAWYVKALPTFADALALVRQQLWTAMLSSTSTAHVEMVQIPRPLFNVLTETLAFAT